MRIGFGKDVHRLVKKRKLVLGGVEIPHDKGLISHSDGDVVIHALVDAIIGALNLGDIGKLFPDTDAKYYNCSSLYFLGKVEELIVRENCKVDYIDIFISAEAPKLGKYVSFMKYNIAQYLKIDEKRISIKCGTNEKLGYIGKKQGIEAYAVVLLKEEKDG